MNMVALDQLSVNMIALEGRLAEAERQNGALRDALARLQNPKTASTSWAPENSRYYVDTGVRCQRTVYIVGLFGSGRHYINDLILQNLGERAKYFRDTIRLHPGPTPMIYSGHATIKYLSRKQSEPEVMRRILEAVRSGFADLIFIYRHPLDSLLTNWIWWRTYLRDQHSIFGISQVYTNTDELSSELELNFPEFKAFADGDPAFFRASPGPRFLSFREFVEETEFHLQSATLKLRLEDFMSAPEKEFSKIVELMSVDLHLSALSIAAPKSRPYRYRSVQEKVPHFKSFIDGLDTTTKKRIVGMGYSI